MSIGLLVIRWAVANLLLQWTVTTLSALCAVTIVLRFVWVRLLRLRATSVCGMGCIGLTKKLFVG